MKNTKRGQKYPMYLSKSSSTIQLIFRKCCDVDFYASAGTFSLFFFYCSCILTVSMFEVEIIICSA